jgi:hypothetical protein
MLKKKVVIKSKKSGPSEPVPKRPVASSKNTSMETGAGNTATSRVYTVGVPQKPLVKSTYIVNNMVKLNLTLSDVNRLEELGHKGLLYGIETPQMPIAWNCSEFSASNSSPAATTEEVANPFKSLIKRNITNLVTSESKDRVTRKDLIINSGMKRHSKQIMQIYSHGWPAHSSHACWYCCHTFNNTPVGIPQLLVNMVFHCYGNFCSYNCAKRYLRPETEDDIAMLQTSTDIFIDDDLGERMQLLELLCHIETNAPLECAIKHAPRRLTLIMFGGDKTIDEFRANFSTNDSYHVFRSPLVPISYQMEECNDRTDKRRRHRVSLDTVKIERAFNELAEKAKKHKGSLGKKMIKHEA